MGTNKPSTIQQLQKRGVGGSFVRILLSFMLVVSMIPLQAFADADKGSGEGVVEENGQGVPEGITEEKSEEQPEAPAPEPEEETSDPDEGATSPSIVEGESESKESKPEADPQAEPEGAEADEGPVDAVGEVETLGAGVSGEEEMEPQASTYEVYRNDTNALVLSTPYLYKAFAACKYASPYPTYTIKVMADDSNIGQTAYVPADATVTLTSGPGGPYTVKSVSAAAANNYHIGVNPDSTLILDNVTLEGAGLGSQAQHLNQGGIYIAGRGHLVMKDGAVITKCLGYAGGAISANFTNSSPSPGDCSFIMEGGLITNNRNSHPTDTKGMYGGGGVYMRSGTFTMKGGAITNNEAIGGQGGGVLTSEYVNFVMEGGTISNNRAQYGGGVSNNGTHSAGSLSAGYGRIDIRSGASITGNTAYKSGGGIYYGQYDTQSDPQVYGNPLNTAVQNGVPYFSLGIESGADVSGNVSSKTYFPPIDYDYFATRTHGKPFDGSLLDNDNINYENPNPGIRYEANNSLGGVYYDTTIYDPGDTATIKTFAETSFTAETGYELDYWSTNPSGTGTKYYPGSTFTLNANTTFYAIYKMKYCSVVEKYQSDQMGTSIDLGTYPDITNNIAAGTTVTLANLSGKIKNIPGYTYTGYMVDGVYTADPTSTGPSISSIATDKTVVYVYSLDLYTIVYSIEDRGSNIASIAAPAAEAGKTWGSSYGKSAPAAPFGKVYVGWKTTPTGSVQTGNPSGTVSGNLTVYLVYGDDTNSNGVEDVRVTRSHRGVDGTALTGVLTPATVIVDLPATYTTAQLGVSQPGWSYEGWNITGSSSTFTAGAPSVSLVPGEDITVTYLYSTLGYTVYYHVVDRGTNSEVITEPFAEGGKTTGDPYGVVVSPAPTNKVYLGWSVGSPGNPLNAASVPISGTVGAADVHIYLLYGDDSNNNGIEDVWVYRFFIGIDATALTGKLSPQVFYADLPGAYTVAQTGVDEPGWDYVGWNTTGSLVTYAAGNPSVTLNPGVDVLVTYLYRRSQYTVTYHIEDRGALPSTITAPSPDTGKTYGSSYSVTAPIAPANKVYLGFKEGASGTLQTGSPSGTVTSSKDVYLVYGDDSNSNGIEDVQVTRTFVGNDGTSLVGNLSPATVTVDLPATYTAAQTGVVAPGWTYAGYNTTGSLLAYSGGSPNIALSPGVNVNVYYVYLKTPYTITYKIEDRGTNRATIATPAPSTGKFYGDPYGTFLSAAPVSKVYVGWKLGSGGALQSGMPTGTVTGNTRITLVYGDDSNDNGIEDVKVTRHFLGTDSTRLTGKLSPAKAIIDLPATYTTAQIGVAESGWKYVGWNTNGSTTSSTSGAPSIALRPGVDRNVYYLYVATYTITEHYVTRTGASLGASAHTTVTKGMSFKGAAAPTFTDHVFVGSTTTAPSAASPSLVTSKATPHMTNVSSSTSVYYVYGEDRVSGSGIGHPGSNGVEDVPVYISWIDDAGKSIDRNSLPTRRERCDVGATFSAPCTYAGTIPVDRIYWGHKVNSGSLQAAPAQPSFVVKLNASLSHTVHYIFTQEKPSAPKPPGPKPSDPGNYEFVKNPNVKKVDAGEIVDYTFAGFGNGWNTPLERYQISDKPDKGLDFKKAKLPAFTNGSGVTYDVTYYTNLSGNRVLYSNVPASSPFEFDAPQLAVGEHITSITFEFGTVPAGFARNDTIQVTFKVWDRPPTKTLVNVGILGYKVGNEFREFATGKAGSVALNGWFDLAKTHDSTTGPMATLALATLVSAVMVGSAWTRRRRQTEETGKGFSRSRKVKW